MKKQKEIIGQQQQTATTRNLSIEDFINKYLIDEIGKIKENHPYMAFVLMSSGIEFLGRYMRNQLTKPNVGRYCFNYAIKNLEPLNSYLGKVGFDDISNLYGEFRCGLIHQYRIANTQIILSDQNSEGARTINCDDFYKAFAESCKDAVAYVKNKNLEPYSFITETPIVKNGIISSTTGTTITQVTTNK